ncbi:MAG: response regulator transcription factor [Candidatus Dormibacteria bacterium]
MERTGELQMTATVLVVEDEAKLRDLIRAFLQREGLTVLSTGLGAEAITLGARALPDLAVLDLGLPDIPGEDVARELRARGDVLLLMLTARAAEEDRIRGLELGADDYLTKPFSPRELVLRVHALLRRGLQVTSEPASRSFGGTVLVIDEVRHEVRLREQPVALSPTEWGILCTLARVPGRVYSRDELANAVRGYEWDGYARVIDSHVKNLRHKLHDDPTSPRIIDTVFGVGYRLCLQRDT